MSRRILLPLLALLAPIIPFVLLMYWAVGELVAGNGSVFILSLLGGVAALVFIEVPMLRNWVIPMWSQALGDRLYGGGYVPADDALVCWAEKVRESKDASLLPQLEQLVRADASRLRGWRELADVQQHVFNRPEDACLTLQEAARHVPDKEERAMLLFRAAHLAETALRRPEEAVRLYGEAADRYPGTVYGRKAATLLP